MKMSEEFQEGIKRPAPKELEPKEPSREEKIEAKVTELCEVNTRRGLESLAREVGLEPTKTEYPDKVSLATAIAEKEIPEEVTEEPVTEAPTEEEATT
ncbi:hypothetical protein ES703_67602 [subsurface metagenome]